MSQKKNKNNAKKNANIKNSSNVKKNADINKATNIKNNSNTKKDTSMKNNTNTKNNSSAKKNTNINNTANIKSNSNTKKDASTNNNTNIKNGSSAKKNTNINNTANIKNNSNTKKDVSMKNNTNIKSSSSAKKNANINNTANIKNNSDIKEDAIKKNKLDSQILIDNEANEIKKKFSIKKFLIKTVKVGLISFGTLSLMFGAFIYVFFKTDLLKDYKDTWVQTAMITDNHQYLARWFLSDEEIQAIMESYEVINDENSVVGAVNLNTNVNGNEASKEKVNEVTYEKISGKGYNGYVITVSDPSKVKLVDTRKKDYGTKLKDVVKEYNAVAAINAGGFLDVDGKGRGNVICTPTIIDGKLLYGDKNVAYSYIGLSREGELILGKYTYKEAIEAGIDDAVQFGPYLIVNGKPQITKSNCGGIHPRTAIGQTKDGKIILVCVDGRKASSLGCNLEQLQQIFIDRGAYNAANLDGGSSSTMYYDGKLVNKPSTPAGERYLPNAIIVEK